MYPVIAQIGPITIYSYGLMMAIAFLTAGYLTSRELTRKGMDGEIASSMVFWAAVGGIVGSRILAILEDLPGFLADPWAGIFTGAGFVWYGGLIGGFLSVSWVIRRNNLPWRATVDCIAPALSLGHAIGRIGCQLAGDGDWGRETTLPWGMAYPNAIVGWDYPPGVVVHPAPLYEFTAYTIIFAFLWNLRKREQPDGTLLWLYFLLGGAARFLIETVRINPPFLFGLTQAQVISIVLMVAGSAQLLLDRYRVPASVQRPGPAKR
jgi:phosphatidylglycerol:prolipoprotein diacylglycerol transferase